MSYRKQEKRPPWGRETQGRKKEKSKTFNVHKVVETKQPSVGSKGGTWEGRGKGEQSSFSRTYTKCTLTDRQAGEKWRLK